MQKSIIITLLTDFGQKDWFVAAMKGEILKINPQVRIIDITHEIQPHNIKSAAFVLWSVYKNFPKQTIHTVVVDPGVGTDRRPIVVKTDDYYFVGPDNGVFSYIFHNEHYYAYQIKIRKRLSKTFHGRDLFAPVAALISKRIKISRIAQPLSKPKSFSFPQPKITRTGIRGEVLY
ncbi:MAG: SAM-dependent chlorinase/fluorinase, partial [candidate division WOR-3 bacterium]